MSIKGKLQPKVPPHHLYCPICGDKAEASKPETNSNCEYVDVRKHCNKCGANWVVRYYMKPMKISEIIVCSEYEDIDL